jgi:hypothetical protein
VTGAAAFTAWLAASVIVLSDGRRGLALGLALMAVAFAPLAWVGGGWPAAGAVFAGGAIAAVQRLRSGTEGWGLMPAGSTSRLILVIAAGVLALWISVSVTSGPAASIRFAAPVVIGLMGARLLAASDPAALMTAVAAMALAIATAAGLAAPAPGLAPYLVAALIAAGVSALRVSVPHVD